MNHGVRRPVRLIPEEGVLARPVVVGDESLVIAPDGVALVASGGREIKQAPDEGSPQPRALFDLPPVFLVIGGLPFLGMPRAPRIGPLRILLVLINAGARAVFAHANWSLRMSRVKVVQELSKLVEYAGIPAEVFVERSDIRNEIARIVQAMI